MNFLLHFQIPKGRHFDDVELLEFTVKYLKQTVDFQRGVGLCAEETKAFLKQHILDRRKKEILLHKLEQRIRFISQQQSIDTIGDIQREAELDQVNQTGAGVLLDLSMKQNRLRETTGHSSSVTPVMNRVCNKLKKREILDKIRQKILNKRRMSDTNQKMEFVQNDIMWRPWRY